MLRRTCGAAGALLGAGTLLRFREACGLDAATAAIGALLLCGMAAALAFVRPEGGRRPPLALGTAALLAGAALGLGVYAARPASSVMGVPPEDASVPVLCELILDDSAGSAKLAAAALRAAEAAPGELIVVGYRASGFIRPGLATPAAPAAFVDYARAANPDALDAAVRTAKKRPRIKCALSASARWETPGALVVRAALDNADAGHAFRGEGFALLVDRGTLAFPAAPPAVAGAVLADTVSLPPGSGAGPWEARIAPPAAAAEGTFEVLVVAADEFVQAVLSVAP